MSTILPVVSSRVELTTSGREVIVGEALDGEAGRRRGGPQLLVVGEHARGSPLLVSTPSTAR